MNRVSTARFRVRCVHIDGAHEATVEIEPSVGNNTGLFTVRPLRKRSKYTLSLAVVAEMVAWKVAKLQADQQRRSR